MPEKRGGKRWCWKGPKKRLRCLVVVILPRSPRMFHLSSRINTSLHQTKFNPKMYKSDNQIFVSKEALNRNKILFFFMSFLFEHLSVARSISNEVQKRGAQKIFTFTFYASIFLQSCPTLLHQVCLIILTLLFRINFVVKQILISYACILNLLRLM